MIFLLVYISGFEYLSKLLFCICIICNHLNIIILSIDVKKIRDDFPILKQNLYSGQLVYFDNGATTQKPKQVIDIINEYYSKHNSNIHRGVHYLSEKTTQAYEKARTNTRKFLNAKLDEEIIFTSGTTEGINLIAYSFGEKYITEGDEIIVTRMEHHSNIVPWQMLCERKKAKLKVLDFDINGVLKIEELDSLISEKTKLISLTHVSNTLGTINPVKEIIEKAHSKNIPVLIDGAQGIQHQYVDVQDLDCDFYIFSGHKIYGPTGIGVVYGKKKYLDEMPPYKGGGDMIKSVSFEKTIYNDLPFKFEAGTTNYIGAIGLDHALRYVSDIGLNNIANYEAELAKYATEQLSNIPGVNIYGRAKEKSSIISFMIDNIHHFDAGMVLDKMNIAVRTGTHCTQPIMDFFEISGTIRASLSFYNTVEEIDLLVEGVKKVKSLFN